ncbi:MAG: hypothetical protein AAF446_06860 [Pseudomonadota bacterium]
MSIHPNSELNVHDIKPFIGAKDFEVSKKFYLALGWRLTYDSPSLSVFELAGHRFYLQNFYAEEWCSNSMLHISVENVSAWLSHAKTVFASPDFPSEARMEHLIKDEGYANTFHVWDPSGVLLHFAQEHHASESA